MLGDITIGQYVDGHSILHRLDPRSKIIGTLFFMIGLFCANSVPGFIGVFVFSMLIIYLSQVPLRFYFKGLKPLVFIAVFTAVIQMTLTPGTYIVHYGLFHISVEGVTLAFFMCSRLILLVLITSVLTLTTTPVALTDALETLLKPFQKVGLPAHELAMMMTIALRFIPTLLEETDKIMKAQTARGADFESGGLIRRAKALLPILVPLFLSSIKRADELALAMEARCYHGGEGRTRMRALQYARRDGIAVLVMAGFMMLMILLRIFI